MLQVMVDRVVPNISILGTCYMYSSKFRSSRRIMLLRMRCRASDNKVPRHTWQATNGIRRVVALFTFVNLS